MCCVAAQDYSAWWEQEEVPEEVGTVGELQGLPFQRNQSVSSCLDGGREELLWVLVP
jgi:hypothetical protein